MMSAMTDTEHVLVYLTIPGEHQPRDIPFTMTRNEDGSIRFLCQDERHRQVLGKLADYTIPVVR
jgi:hypothetical protein